MPRKGVKINPDLVELDVDLIEVPAWARKIERDYLVESVEERGIIQPLVVAKLKIENRNHYFVIDGVGRLQLAKQQKLEKVPVRLVDVDSELDAILLAIELQATHEDWDLMYTLNIIQQLENRGLSRKEIADRLKIPRSKLYRLLWIKDFPFPIQKLFLEEKLPLRAADKIKSVLDKLGDDHESVELFLSDIRDNANLYEDICKDWLEMLEEQEEEKPEQHVPAGTEQKLIPASQIPVPEPEQTVEEPREEEEEVEEVEVEREEEQEEEEEEGEEEKEEEEEEMPEWAELAINVAKKTGFDGRYHRYTGEVVIYTGQVGDIYIRIDADSLDVLCEKVTYMYELLYKLRDKLESLFHQ